MDTGLIIQLEAAQNQVSDEYFTSQLGNTTLPGISLTKNLAIGNITLVGDPVTFGRSEDSPGTVDPISPLVTIARANTESIFNVLAEASYQITSPLLTEWNADGWDNLADVATRTYDTFINAIVGPVGENVVGKRLIMHLTSPSENTRYFMFLFLSWTSGGDTNGKGGLIYTRQEITTQPAEGTPVVFTRPNNRPDVVDIISPRCTLARGSTESIYNLIWESQMRRYASPVNTEWTYYTDAWGDLSDVRTRTYMPFTLACDENVGTNVVGAEFVMHIISEDRYFKVKFSQWTGGGPGGGFTYTRTELFPSQVRLYTNGRAGIPGTAIAGANTLTFTNGLLTGLV
jgi:hypothetical protein